MNEHELSALTDAELASLWDTTTAILHHSHPDALETKTYRSTLAAITAEGLRRGKAPVGPQHFMSPAMSDDERPEL